MHYAMDLGVPQVLDGLNTSCVVFDVETTGLSREKDRIIEFAGIRLEKGVEVQRLQFFINPEKWIPYKIVELTGITQKMVENEPNETYFASKLLDFFSGVDVVVGHNVTFDLGMLDGLFQRNGYNFECSYVDTLSMARKYMTGLGSYKLTSLATELHLDTQGAHRAMEDVKMTLGLLVHLARLAVSK